MEPILIPVREIARYQKREDSMLIDMREKGEFQKAHLAGALWWDGEEKMATWRKDKLLIFCCHRGNLSLQTANAFAQKGYRTGTMVGGYEALRQLTEK